VGVTPEQQQQFNQELQLVIAVAAQIRSCYGCADSAVLGAMELIQAAEKLLKGHYEPTKEIPVSTGVGVTSDRVGQGGGEPKPTIPTGTPKPSRKVINDSISAASQVILAKKLRTQDELKKMLEAYQVNNKMQLTDDQAVELLGQLNAITKE
jgi:hypothetical protein